MCTRHYLLNLGGFLLAASVTTLTLGGTAMAQIVQVFDGAPPIEVLRSIMIPESQPGLGRSIVMQRPDTSAATTGVQRTSVRMQQPAPAPASIAAADTPARVPESVSVPAADLSERRALSVAEYPVKCGVAPSRLLLIGKGMSEPLTQNPYDPANRRVQFVRVG